MDGPDLLAQNRTAHHTHIPVHTRQRGTAALSRLSHHKSQVRRPPRSTAITPAAARAKQKQWPATATGDKARRRATPHTYHSTSGLAVSSPESAGAPGRCPHHTTTRRRVRSQLGNSPLLPPQPPALGPAGPCSRQSRSEGRTAHGRSPTLWNWAWLVRHASRGSIATPNPPKVLAERSLAAAAHRPRGMASDGTFQNLLLALLLCPALASSVRTLIVLLAAACSSGRACAELVALLLCTCVMGCQVGGEASRRFWIENDTFVKDGAPFQIVGGDVHYFRIVPEVRFFFHSSCP